MAPELPNGLTASGLSRQFGATKALRKVDLHFRPGRVHAVIGANGAGKSTAMKILAGVFPADQGEMQLNGRPYRPRNENEARRLGVSTVFQEGAVIPELTVLENIFLGQEIVRWGGFVNRKAMVRQAQAALSRLRRQIPLDRLVGELTISDQQMVEIARALAVGNPNVIILDEPTSSLGNDDANHLLAVVRELAQQGLAVIYISHFMQEVATVCDDFTVLRDGELAGSGELKTVTIGQIIQLMLGRTLGVHQRTQRTAGNSMLELESLRAVGVESASLDVHSHAVVGVFGLVGSGRTELLESIFGLRKVQQGSIRIGSAEGTTSPADLWRSKVGFLCEDRRVGLWGPLSIAHNLTAVNQSKPGSLGFLSNGQLNARALPWIKRLGIKCEGPAQAVGHLSGGNQQKVALARLLESDCRVWILDEPTRGIDLGARAEVLKLIDETASAGGAVLMVSSSPEELLEACDRIAVMHRGYLSPAYPVSQMSESRLMIMATSGFDN